MPSTDRRTFLEVAAASGTALALGLLPSPPPRPAPRSGASLRILILGGTGFIGPYQVQYALGRGHTVTLFNRGRTNPHLFPDVEKLVGDRDGDLSALEGRRWDVVIDNSASDPTRVERSAKLLQDTVDLYLFVSTRSVYYDTSRVPMTVDADVFSFENTSVAPGARLPYGLAKALSEQKTRELFPGRALIVRPSLIVGPGDLTDRFTYWPVRIERGGEVLAPGDGSDYVQIIDARDLSEWMIRLAEQRATGTYNALGPQTPWSFAGLLHGIKAVTTADARFTWVDTDFLLANDVRPYREMPVWMPARDGREGFGRFDISREVALGLTFRPLAVTARDTLDYYHAQSEERQQELRAGIAPEREAEVLRLWHARPR
ncbi:MAG: NAD-dependent epimerase/dehydratase family protein [Gemmatimonadota bacterium]|nr:NAD-dependent epimerase/dehydratase family protein [Gemmatimonadota bacterium]MDH4350399.1 NAD-dependent epimerase/dehydratase family protein [Gemmatimonadota bacterium]MDH5197114.1 NAD-dependent epimerase/dehydratase family protein [Gemmatimonadota bacterium]